MTCPRARYDVYLRIEKGEEDEHVASCAECSEAVKAARQLRELLPHVGAERRPRPDWQASVLAAIDSGDADRGSRRWSRWWLAAVPAAAALLLLLLWSRGPIGSNRTDGPIPALAVELSIVRGSAVTRTKTANAGDLLRVRASGGSAHSAIWIYRGEQELLLRCPADPRCRSEQGTLIADLRLDRPGVYLILFAASSSPIPPAGETIDRSMAALAGSGARYTLRDVDVY